MKRLFTLFLFVFCLMATQTSVAVDSHDGDKPQVETSFDVVDVSTTITISDDLQYHQIINLEIRYQSDTSKRLDKLFRQANKSFHSKFTRHYGNFNYKTILKYPLKDFKDNLIRSPSN